MSLGEALDPDGSERGALYTLDLNSGKLSTLSAEGIAVPSGLAMGSDCTTLHVTATTTPASRPCSRSQPSGALPPRPIAARPLCRRTGVHVDEDDVAWVMDHLAVGDDGEGALFAITLDGGIESVLSGIRMGAPGGVSLAAGGETAVIPEVDALGNARLISVSTVTGEQTVLQAPQMLDPAGIRTAREAGVFVVVDNEGGAIFRAR